MITGITAWQERSDLVVLMSTDGKAIHRESVLDNPPRVVLDFVGLESRIPFGELPIYTLNVRQVRTSQYKNADPMIVRVVFDLLERNLGKHVILSEDRAVRVVFHSRDNGASPESAGTSGPSVPGESLSNRRWIGSISGISSIEDGLPENGRIAMVLEDNAQPGVNPDTLESRAIRSAGSLNKVESKIEGAGSEIKKEAQYLVQVAESYQSAGDFSRALGIYDKLLRFEDSSEWIRGRIVNLNRQKLQAVESALIPDLNQVGPAMLRDRIPEGLIWLSVGSRCAIVEKETQTFLLFHRLPEGLQLERVFACSTGAKEGAKTARGDERTPEGIFFFGQVRPGSLLPEIYGTGALTLDYPSPYDAIQGKKGGGIWVHGTNRPLVPYLPKQSRGCIVLRNEDLNDLLRIVTLNETPMLIVQKIQYQDTSRRQDLEQSFEAFLRDWHTRWENKAIDPYIGMYSNRFRSGAMNVKAWKSYKEAVFQRAGRIQLRAGMRSIVCNESYAVMTFDQSYRSDQLVAIGTKRLFLMRDEGTWKIIFEDWRGQTLPIGSGPTVMASEFATH